MKSNIKKKSRYGISILIIAIILMMIPTGMAAVTVDRSIDSTTITAGNSTNVTVVIVNDGTDKSLSLQEIIPTGWAITRGTDTADQFKSITNEWVWFTVSAGATQTVIYTLKVPTNAAAGIYNINGNLTSVNDTISVAGDNAITVVNKTPVKTNGSFDFVVSPTSATVNVGVNAIYTLTISNTGSAEDTYILGVDNGNNNATANVDKKSVTIGAGSSSTVILTVNGSSIGTYTIDVTATSEANGSNVKSVTTTTNVTKAQPTVDDFNFVVSPKTATINVGASVTYTLTVSNIGGKEDTYSLATGSIPNNATVNLSRKNATIGPGNSSDVSLTVSGSVTGTYTVNVTATSGANKSNVKNVTTTTSVVVNAPPSSSSGSVGSSSGDGTYPTFTATPAKTSNATAGPTVTTTVVPTVTSTEARPTEAVKETPIDMTTKKGAPGFGIVLAIGMLGAIYILRRMK